MFYAFTRSVYIKKEIGAAITIKVELSFNWVKLFGNS
tara:strand:+ start:722 stop:832 length:111 start_codon:yes stop_codon:yes gene_type:complete